MKYSIFLFLLSCSLSFSNNDKPITSTVKAVTVFVNGAEITRTANITLPIGTTQFTFDKLSPYIQENSIQVSGLKNASIISINYGINYITKQDKSEDIEAFQDKIKALNDLIQLEDDLISGYEEELNIITENRQLGNNNQVVNLEKLKEFTAYYRKRVTEIKNAIHKSVKKKRELDAEINALKSQLRELNADDKVQTGEIKLKLNTTNAVQLNLTIKYNVTNAGWFPIYDLKAQDINKPLNLAYKAHVYQNTGTNWEDVKLTLSTNDPYTNNLKPELNPKYLNFISGYYQSENATKKYNYKYNPFIQTVSGIVTDGSGVPLPGANVIVKGTSNGTVTDFDGAYSIQASGGKELVFSYVGFKSESLPIHSSVINLNLEEDMQMLEEVAVVGYGKSERSDVTGSVSSIKMNDYTNNYSKPKENQTATGEIIVEGISNTNFEIQKQQTIPSDGDISVIEIDHFEVPATYSYFAAPIVNENVFLTAKIGEWQQYNLLPGEANIYFEGSYSGKTSVNPYATTDSLTVSLGVDPNINIKRKATNNFKKVNTIGSNKIISKAYEIELKNNKKTAIDLIIMDRIPISQNKDIKVDDIEYNDCDYDSKKGLLKWTINIKPSETKTYKFSYALKYPKYQSINL
ncbi:mucoidy inhibitor MuiA family protein [Flavobacteriaceae bacterium SZ-1-7]|uniref:mucoidy inhibitor MuiA family protein n=1 Tax=Tamlana sedimenti TaxID=3134126 RepID=UPI003129304A